MSTEMVASMADQLRQYATHFEIHDWDYTRDLGDLSDLRHSRAEDRLLGRLKTSWGWLTRRYTWEKELGAKRFYMALHCLRRRRHLPDGVLDNGCIITIWEETGEYLQYVQPSIGALLADLMDAHPDLPEVRALAAEMKRINDRYGERVAQEEAS